MSGIKKVLIVEDEVINAMALAQILPKWGCHVVDTVTSGEDAMRAVKERKPDVVLMDIAIHGSIDGLETARRIIGKWKIPVIFMTGHDDEDTLLAAKALKPLGFLVKPLNASRLKDLLKKL